MLTFVDRLVAVSAFVPLCFFPSPPPVYRVVIGVVGEAVEQHGGGEDEACFNQRWTLFDSVMRRRRVTVSERAQLQISNEFLCFVSVAEKEII